MNIGDSARMVIGDDTVFGVVRKLTPRQVWVWTGTTGFGQKVWPFDRKTGEPIKLTLIAFPGIKLDLAYVDAFKVTA
jgi:hypothetical protein